MIIISTFLICSTVLLSLVAILEFKREEREHKDVIALSALLEAELSKVHDLKSRVDILSLKVGLR